MKLLFKNRIARSPVTRPLLLSQCAPGLGMPTSQHVPCRTCPWATFDFLSSLLLEVGWAPLTLLSWSSILARQADSGLVHLYVVSVADTLEGPGPWAVQAGGVPGPGSETPRE